MAYRQTVTDVIKDVQGDLDLAPNTRFKLSNIARDFLRELNNDTLPNIKTQRFEIPANRIIPLPLDYVDWTKAAIQYQEGLKLLASNSQMAKGVSSNGVPALFNGTNIWNMVQGAGNNIPYTYLYGFGGYGLSGRLQAFGNGNNLGYFTIDEIQNVIRLNPVLNIPNFYLEYLSDCSSNNDETEVHPYAIQCMKVYIKYHYLKNRRDSFYQAFEGELLVEYKEMRNRFSGLDMATIVNVVEQTWGVQE